VGTSQSSNGPGPGVPLVPPWADNIDFPVSDGGDEAPESTDPDQAASVPVAPRARFRGARRALGEFARAGNDRRLHRALAHYVRTGYSGAGTMTRRMSRTATTAGRLNGVLQSGRAPDGTELRDAILASGNDANVVLDAIVDAASPADGTQDKESSRRAIRDALSDLLVRFPDADFFALTDAQRAFVIERYTALDVYGRFCLDLQKAIMDKSADPATALRRLKQVREFIAEHVAAAFRAIRERGTSATTSNVAQLTRDALRATFSVFEEYTG
jgi:hypothetical protein